MKLNNSDLLFLLAVVILITAGVIFLNNSKKKGAFPYEELTFVASEITKLKIIPSYDITQSLLIHKKDNTWYVSQYQLGVPADTAFVETVLKEIEKIRPDQFITDDPDLWQNYGVDSSGTLVIIYQENDKKTAFVVGNMTFIDDIYVSSYIRLLNDNRVFVTECYLEGTLKKERLSWVRKKTKDQ